MEAHLPPFQEDCGDSHDVVSAECSILYLNIKNEMIGSEDLGEGTVSEAVAFPRKIVEGALRLHATSVILAHNHPGGLAEPSDNDDRLAEAVKQALKMVDISLQEHIIISDEGYFSYKKEGI